MAKSNFTLYREANRDEFYHYYGDSFVIPMCFILSVVMLLAVGGNVMVILTIIRHRTMRTRTNMFIVSLAVADILVAICDMPFSIITLIKGYWVFGDGFCEFNGVTMSLFLVASIQTLMFISVHKYISITRPFSRYMTPRRIILMIAITWIWSFIYAIAGVSGWTRNVYKTGASQCGPVLPETKAQLSHSVTNTITNFTIPLIVMCFCYTNIFCEIRRHMSRMRENTNIDMRNSIMQQKRISVTLFVVLICFLVCWSPYIIYSCYAAFVKNKDKVPKIANPLAYWCGYINSACNPIIYAFRSPSFRQGYYSIVCGKQQRQYHSTGSFSQRSPSFRKRSIHHNNVNNTTSPGVNGFGDSSMEATARPSDEVSYNPTSPPEVVNSEIKSKSSKRPKRLLTMDSWASIRLPSLTRQWSTHSPITPNAPPTPEDAVFTVSPPLAKEAPEQTTTCSLSPIQEGSHEDLSSLPIKIAVDIGCAVAFSKQNDHSEENCNHQNNEHV
ncbi:hypothetical protein CHUAL_011480 [Chamberlinius hualienensis]